VLVSQDSGLFLNVMNFSFQTAENLFYKQLYSHNSLNLASQDNGSGEWRDVGATVEKLELLVFSWI
jgi:hypothetical protein